MIEVLGFARRAGFTLAEIRTLFHADPDKPLGERWKDLAEQKLAELDRLIAQATQMKEAIRIGMSCGCVRLDDCIVAHGSRRQGAKTSTPGGVHADDGFRQDVRPFCGDANGRRICVNGNRRPSSSGERTIPSSLWQVRMLTAGTCVTPSCISSMGATSCLKNSRGPSYLNADVSCEIANFRRHRGHGAPVPWFS
jgi:DNA-binding transcriptional MerR regulator